MGDYEFQSVFDGSVDDENEFETMLGGDGDLIDVVSGIKEDGSCALDDEETLHHNETDAEPEDFEDELGEDHDTDNAPDNAEGSEGADEEFALGEALGENKPTSADHFYEKETEDDLFEGKDENPDETDLDGESDSVINAAIGEGGDCDGCDEEDDDEDLGDPDDVDIATGQGIEEATEHEYEPGDSDLVDEVIGSGDDE